jgi:phospholipid transport system substrate-binding protein
LTPSPRPLTEATDVRPKILPSLCLAAALAIPSLALAGETAGAMEAFRASHSEVTTLVDEGAPATDLQAKVDALLDYDWIAKAALGGENRYAERCETRCDEFKELLSRLIRENYLKRVFKKDRGTVVYIDEKVRKKASKVNTLVTYTTDEGITHTIEVAYVMHKVDGEWHVRDMITDGVSLAKTYKYEFKKLHKEGGIDLIISRLESKLSEIAKADTTPPAKP